MINQCIELAPLAGEGNGVDAASLLIDFLERNAAPGNPRTKGKG